MAEKTRSVRVTDTWRRLVSRIWSVKGHYGWDHTLRVSRKADAALLARMIKAGHVENIRGNIRLTAVGRAALGLEVIDD